jgi:hypothetical protein
MVSLGLASDAYRDRRFSRKSSVKLLKRRDEFRCGFDGFCAEDTSGDVESVPDQEQFSVEFPAGRIREADLSRTITNWAEFS